MPRRIGTAFAAKGWAAAVAVASTLVAAPAHAGPFQVAEPGTLVLIGAGLIVLWWAWKRRH